MSDEIPRTDAGKAREGFVDELNTITEYEDMADASSDPELKEQFEEVIDDERVHCGNFAHMLERTDPKAAPKMKEGYQESEKMGKALPSFKEMMGIAKAGTSMPNREHWNDQKANRSRARSEGQSQLRGSPTFPDKKWRGGAIPLITNDLTVQTSWPDQNAAIRAGKADYATSAHLPKHPYRLGIAPTSSDTSFDYWEGTDKEHPTLKFSRPKDGSHLGYIFPGQDGPISYSVWGEGEGEVVRGPEGHQLMIYYDDPKDYSKGGRFAAITPSSDEWDIEPQFRTVRHPPKRNVKTDKVKTKTGTGSKKKKVKSTNRSFTDKQLDNVRRRLSMNKSSITKDLVDRDTSDQVLEGKAAGVAQDLARTLFGKNGPKRYVTIHDYIDNHPDIFGDVPPESKSKLFDAISDHLLTELSGNVYSDKTKPVSEQNAQKQKQLRNMVELFMGRKPSNIGGMSDDERRRKELDIENQRKKKELKDMRRGMDTQLKEISSVTNRAGAHKINPAEVGMEVSHILGTPMKGRLSENVPRLTPGVEATPEQLKAIKNFKKRIDLYINAANEYLPDDQKENAIAALKGAFVPDPDKGVIVPPTSFDGKRRRVETGYASAEQAMKLIDQAVNEAVSNRPSTNQMGVGGFGGKKYNQAWDRHNAERIVDENTQNRVKDGVSLRDGKSSKTKDIENAKAYERPESDKRIRQPTGEKVTDNTRLYGAGFSVRPAPTTQEEIDAYFGSHSEKKSASFSEMLKSANEEKWKEKGLPAGTHDKTLPAYYRYVDMSPNDPINVYEHEKMGKDKGVSMKQMSFNHIR